MCPILRLLPSPLKSTNMLISAMCPTLRSIPSQLICPIMLILAKYCWYSFVPYVNSTFSIDLSFSSPTTTIEIANIHAPYFISIRGKWRSYGLSYFLQVSIADKVLKVAASLFCSGSHRQIAKSFQRRRLSERDVTGCFKWPSPRAYIGGRKLLETPGAIYTKPLVGRVWKVLEIPRDVHTSLHYGGRHGRSPRLSRDF